MYAPIKEEDQPQATQRGRGRPRDEDARSRILEASLEVLEEVGYPNVTCDAIADRAGASKATIYRWWPHKEAVMLEALRDAIAQEMPFPDTGNLREDIRLQLRNFQNLLSGPRSRVFKGFIAAAQSDPKVADAFRTIWVKPRRESALAGMDRYEHALREGVDLQLVLDAMYGPLYYRLLIGLAPLSPDFTDALTNLIWSGIGRE